MVFFRSFVLLVLCLSLASCASIRLHGETGKSVEASASAYRQKRLEQGVVLLDVRWGRQWPCGQYQNAQLISFTFDKMPLVGRSDDAPADLTIATVRRVRVRPWFENYALLVPPGDYALSGFTIKVAQSASQVGYWVAGRSDLFKEGRPIGGQFTVMPGEAVYIGNFALDCQTRTPTLWRYYTSGESWFSEHLLDYKNKYPFLDLSDVTYRLFETELFGVPYKLGAEG